MQASSLHLSVDFERNYLRGNHKAQQHLAVIGAWPDRHWLACSSCGERQRMCCVQCCVHRRLDTPCER